MKRKDTLILKYVTMIDTVPGWYEITQYNNKKVIPIGNLAETMWLIRSPWPVEITYD